ANWIQNLGWRQMVMRRYHNERDKDPFIRFVAQTREKPQGQLPAPLSDIKEKLLRKRAILIKDALATINQRKLVYNKAKKRPSL
ncbi:MAG: hypothetical protein GY803_14810, partial [Chloroflexi bacterium]|nr:hypothetical protein [Chloroflexota bacterium]